MRVFLMTEIRNNSKQGEPSEVDNCYALLFGAVLSEDITKVNNDNYENED
jgi:hypothetical protein